MERVIGSDGGPFCAYQAEALGPNGARLWRGCAGGMSQARGRTVWKDVAHSEGHCDHPVQSNDSHPIGDLPARPAARGLVLGLTGVERDTCRSAAALGGIAEDITLALIVARREETCAAVPTAKNGASGLQVFQGDSRHGKPIGPSQPLD